MHWDKDHIRQLVMEELSGTISDDDAVWLQQIIAENAEAWSLYTQLHRELDTTTVYDGLNELEYWLPAGKILTAVRKKKKRSAILIASIASFLIIAAASYIIFKPSETQPVKMASALKEEIALELANGDIVPLPLENQQMQVGNITFNNAEKKLTYAAQDNSTAAWAVLNVPAGKDYKVQLSDGTEIWLNSASRLQFPFTFNGKTRDVTISGEAFFKVAKNTAQPFIVHMPNSTVRVLGTSFNVNTYDPGQVTVSLLSGSISMVTGDTAVTLEPGYELSYDGKKGIEKDKFDEDNVLSWQNGIYLCNEATPEEVCRVLNRWFNIKAVVDNPKITHGRYTGLIDRNKSLQTALDNIKENRPFDYSFDKDSILHIR